MTMPCHITDYRGPNPWDDEQSSPLLRELNELSLADLMGEDHWIWLAKNNKFGYVLEIENEEGEVIKENCIHPRAARSLADFCKRYLSFYNKLEDVA